MLKRFTSTFIWLLVFVLGSVAQADTLKPVSELDGVVEYRLDNGLRVILAEDQSTNTTFFNLVYFTGSLVDPQGKGGTAHLLEHLMFRGTGQRSAEQVISGLRQRGIQFNANTSFDRTLYRANFDADPARLDYLLELEAERMVGLAFGQAALESEIKVVLREMELAQDDSFAVLTQHMLAAATPGKGYGRSVLGSREDLGNITLADLKQFHSAHYQPDNAVILITGKFDRGTALAAVQHHFAGLTNSSSARRIAQLAPPPALDEPVMTSVTQGDVDVVTLAYPLPPAVDTRNRALAALVDMFAGEPHGRLYQELVVPGKALGVLALQQSFEQGGYYLFSAQLAPGQSMEQAQTQLIEQIESVATQPISQAELQRVQAANKHMKRRILREPDVLAQVLSESAAVGDWQLLLQRYDQIAELDTQSVQEQAEAHFVAQRRLLGKLHAGSQSAVAPEQSPAVKVANSGTPVVETVAPQAVDVAAFNKEIMAVENIIQRNRLDNGLKLALRPMQSSSGPVRGIMTLRFGDVQSLFGKGAVADLTASLLVRGSRKLSYQQIVDQANQLGAGLSVRSSGNAVRIRFETPAENLSAFLELMTEVLKRPAFPSPEFELIKRQRIQSLVSADDRPASVAGLQLRRYEEGYPVGDIRRHIERDEMRAAVKEVNRKDVVDFHETFYGVSHGEFVLAGDFDSQQVRDQLEGLFGDWHSQRPNTRFNKPYVKIAAARIHAKADAAQTGYYIGRLNFAANIKSEDAAALFIAEHILGRHPVASRLGKRLREEENLTYDIRSTIKVATFNDASWVSIQGSYPRGQGPQLANIVREEVTRLAESGISQQELDNARNTILNERRLSLSQDKGILSSLSRQLYEDSTMQSWVERNNAFAAVNLEEVNAVMRRYLDANKLVEILADADGRKHSAEQPRSAF